MKNYRLIQTNEKYFEWHVQRKYPWLWFWITVRKFIYKERAMHYIRIATAKKEELITNLK